MKTTIEITDDQIVEVTRLNLIEMYKDAEISITYYMERDVLTASEQKDMQDAKQILKSISEVIDYMSYPSSIEEYPPKIKK